MHKLDHLKSKLPTYLRAIGVEIRSGTNRKLTCRCPLHEDRSPSFRANEDGNGWLWYCDPCQRGGSVYDLAAALLGKDARRDFREVHEHVAKVLGVVAGIPAMSDPTPRPKPPKPVATGPTIPEDATQGIRADWERLAALRNLDWRAAAQAARLGCLLFAKVGGFKSWIITDPRRLCAEARRMDGEHFPALPAYGLKARKAHCLKGSVKSWPVGLAVKGFKLGDFRLVMLTEGGPDFLAGIHFSLADDANCWPMTFLGVGAGNTLHPEAPSLIKGVRVRLFPHADGPGAGAGVKWGNLLHSAGANVEGVFDFRGFITANGAPCKDLNDLAEVHPGQAAKLRFITR